MWLRALVALLVFAGPARADLAAADARAPSCVAAMTAVLEPVFVEHFKAAIAVCVGAQVTQHDEQWRTACASQLRSAREQLVARDPFFRDLKLDEKMLDVGLQVDRQSYELRVIAPDDSPDEREWGGGFSDCFRPDMSCQSRTWHRREGVLFMRGAHRAAFAAVLRPAADRCLESP